MISKWTTKHYGYTIIISSFNNESISRLIENKPDLSEIIIGLFKSEAPKCTFILKEISLLKDHELNFNFSFYWCLNMLPINH